MPKAIVYQYRRRQWTVSQLVSSKWNKHKLGRAVLGMRLHAGYSVSQALSKPIRKARDRIKGKLSYAEIKKLYKTKSINQIAELDGTSANIIQRALHTMKVKVRGRGGDGIGKPKHTHGHARFAKQMGMAVDRYYRLKVIVDLGGKCSKCKIDDLRVLEINHIDGRGKHLSLSQLCVRILKGQKRYRHMIDVRCANCNVLHEYERGNRKDPRPLMKQRAKMELVRA
jgi:hypothetical protein